MTKNKPAPQNADVYEIYGKTARSRGWDFMVCTSAKEAIDLIESDIDELDPDPDSGDEVRIVFRRYTPTQMEDVIYED
jgi:hypothetical protein